MMAAHVHDALSQVRRLRQLIVEKRSFRGYSGVARVISGALALTVAGVLLGWGESRPAAFHLAAWGAVAAVALLLNYGAMAAWFLFDAEVGRQPGRLMPAADALPALAVGAALTVALVLRGQYDLLFGVWMTSYGVAHVAHRQSLPGGTYAVGLFYLLAGTLCLLVPGISFRDPRPMGIVFFVGEWAGGYALIRLGRRLAPADSPDRTHREHPPDDPGPATGKGGRA